MRFLKIEWRNTKDLGQILYQDGYTNRIYLDVEVEEPEYPVTIESDLNGDNVEIPRFKKWEKKYHFRLYCTEDLVDAFTLMQLHDNITITLQTGQSINVSQLRAEVEWQEYGCLALVDVTFTEDYIIATNCDENLDTGCYCEELAGTFEFIDEYPDGTPNPAGKTGLLWTDDPIPPNRYVAAIYVASNAYTWLAQPTPEQYACYTNEADSSTWIFDGQYWHKMPGYIYAGGHVGGTDCYVTAWVPPGAFGKVFWLASIGWVEAGDFTADELAGEAHFDISEPGHRHVKLQVWNHNCTYGYTNEYEIEV